MPRLRRNILQRATDSVVGIFSPQAEASRLRAPSWSHNYIDGTGYSRARSTTLYTTQQDYDKTITRYSREQCAAIAERLAHNAGLVKKLARMKANWAASSFAVKSASTDREWGNAAEDWFRQWSKICDATGRHDFESLAWLNSVSITVTGEIFYALTATESGWPLIQPIRSHRICSPDGDETSSDGIVLDSVGRPVSYILKTGDKYEPLPASGVHHLYDPLFTDGTRGLSAFDHAVGNLLDWFELRGSEKIALKMSSAIGFLRRNATGEPEDALEDPEQSTVSRAAGLPLESFLSGVIPWLDDAESFEQFKSERPSGEWMNFVNSLLRDICIGVEIPYPLAVNTTEVGGPDVRALLADTDLAIRRHQKPLVKWAERCWGYAISKAIKMGQLPPAPQDWWKIRVQTPPKPSVDIGRQATADLALYDAGLLSGDEIVSSRGGDLEDTLTRKAEEVAMRKELAAQYGVEPSEIGASKAAAPMAPQQGEQPKQ